MEEVTSSKSVEEMIDKVKVANFNESVYLDLKQAFKQR